MSSVVRTGKIKKLDLQFAIASNIKVFLRCFTPHLTNSISEFVCDSLSLTLSMKSNSIIPIHLKGNVKKSSKKFAAYGISVTSVVCLD